MKDWTAADRRHRERLERNSLPGQRANAAGMVNALVKLHDGDALPGMCAYAFIKSRQNDGSAQAREARRHNIAHAAFEEFNRLHPGSALRKAAGGIVADRQTSADYWGDGSISPAEDVLSVEDMRHIAAQRWRNRFF